LRNLNAGSAEIVYAENATFIMAYVSTVGEN